MMVCAAGTSIATVEVKSNGKVMRSDRLSSGKAIESQARCTTSNVEQYGTLKEMAKSSMTVTNTVNFKWTCEKDGTDWYGQSWNRLLQSWGQMTYTCCRDSHFSGGLNYAIEDGIKSSDWADVADQNSFEPLLNSGGMDCSHVDGAILSWGVNYHATKDKVRFLYKCAHRGYGQNQVHGLVYKKTKTIESTSFGYAYGSKKLEDIKFPECDENYFVQSWKIVRTKVGSNPNPDWFKVKMTCVYFST